MKRTRWYEFAVRFALGGLVTAGAALISKWVGASFGGLFLAFPAIFAASTTLVARHEQRHKRERGQEGRDRGRQAAGADAAGAALGSVGLAAFAAVVWGWVGRHNAVVVIGGATAVWGGVCLGVWWGWRRCRGRS